jgi:hypothetical protein
MEEIFGIIEIELDKKWIYFIKKEDKYSYIKIGVDKNEAQICKKFFYINTTKCIKDIKKYEKKIEKLGKNLQDLIESSERIYDILAEKREEYVSFDHHPLWIFFFFVGAFLLIFSPFLIYYSFTIPEKDVRILFSLLTGFIMGGGFISFLMGLSNTKFFNKKMVIAKKEIKKILKTEGIKFKKILQYDLQENSLTLKI